MSWIDEIKIAKWLNNGVANLATQGVNLIGLGALAVDNPNTSTVLPDGSIAIGRTELQIIAPNQPLIWFAQAAPTFATGGFVGNYGGFFASPHGKLAVRRFQVNAIRWRSQGITPAANPLLVQLYHNGVSLGATWQMTIPASAGPNYAQELRPSVPYITGTGGILGVTLTQAGSNTSANMRAVISVS